MAIVLPIYFPKPVLGKLIVEAIRAICADRELVEEIGFDNDFEGRTVGQSTQMSNDYVIRVGENFAKDVVAFELRYASLAVADADWPGLKRAVRREQAILLEEQQYFHERLMVKLAELMEIDFAEIVRKTAECKGSGITDIRYACPNCNSGFKTNPGTCPNCGAPLGDVEPIY